MPKQDRNFESESPCARLYGRIQVQVRRSDIPQGLKDDVIQNAYLKILLMLQSARYLRKVITSVVIDELRATGRYAEPPIEPESPKLNERAGPDHPDLLPELVARIKSQPHQLLAFLYHVEYFYAAGDIVGNLATIPFVDLIANLDEDGRFKGLVPLPANPGERFVDLWDPRRTVDTWPNERADQKGQAHQKLVALFRQYLQYTSTQMVLKLGWRKLFDLPAHFRKKYAEAHGMESSAVPHEILAAVPDFPAGDPELGARYAPQGWVSGWIEGVRTKILTADAAQTRAGLAILLGCGPPPRVLVFFLIHMLHHPLDEVVDQWLQVTLGAILSRIVEEIDLICPPPPSKRKAPAEAQRRSWLKPILERVVADGHTGRKLGSFINTGDPVRETIAGWRRAVFQCAVRKFDGNDDLSIFARRYGFARSGGEGTPAGASDAEDFSAPRP